MRYFYAFFIINRKIEWAVIIKNKVVKMDIVNYKF